MSDMSELTRYTYHRVFDGYNFLSRTGVMEEIVGCDMELVSAEDYDTLAARVAELEGDVNQLNNVLRQAGWGQGEIDSAAYTFDKLATANARLAQQVKELTAQLVTVTAERDEYKAYADLANKTVHDIGANYRAQLAARTYTWTTSRPTVPGWYWYRDDASDNDPMIIDIQEVSFVSGQGHWAGPILGPEEAK